MKKFPRILFFIVGTMPSDKAQLIAEDLGPNVAFRNASLVSKTECLEKCDGVAGEVPAAYAKLPKAKDVIAKFKKERKESLEARIKANEEKEKALAKPEDQEEKEKVENVPVPNANIEWKANA